MPKDGGIYTMSISKRTLQFSVSSLILLLAIQIKPAAAQAPVPVIDAANLAENAAIFLKNAAMLKIMIDNIQKGQGSWETALPLLEELDAIIKQGEALAYGDPNIQQTFEDKFPGYKITDELWEERSELWTNTQLDTLRNVLLSVNKQSETFQTEQPFVESMIAQSNAAVGHMQALQHGNALVGANVTQLVKLRQLIMSQINADTVYRSAETARRAESEAKGIAWASAAPRTLIPMSKHDRRAVGNLDFIKPRR